MKYNLMQQWGASLDCQMEKGVGSITFWKDQQSVQIFVFLATPHTYNNIAELSREKNLYIPILQMRILH